MNFPKIAQLSAQLFFHNTEKWPEGLLRRVCECCPIFPNFISPKEEQNLLKEIEPHMKRLRYEKTHWDDAIYLYREREQRNWSAENSVVIQRILDASFPDDLIRSEYVHILDLHKDGYIKPHTDAVRYCGDVVSGISLLSDSVMRLRHHDNKDELVVDMLLSRLSLYKLSGLGRYNFTHEILSNQQSYFNGEKIEKDRRISVICRDVPKSKSTNEIVFREI